MRAPRIPINLPHSLPISFSHQICPVSKRVELVITAHEEWSTALLDGLSLLSHFTQQAKRHLESGYRELRTQETIEKLHADYRTIQSAYQALRASGLKHRAAVHHLVADPSLPFHGRWEYSDFNHCVRSAPASPPKLRAVPHTPKSLHR